MKVICNNKKCSVIERSVIASGQQNYFSISFEFDSSWDGLVKTARFYHEDLLIDTLDIIVLNDCNLPVRLTERFGDIYIEIIGENNLQEEIIKTNKAFFCKLLRGPNLTVDEIKRKIIEIAQ